MKRSLLLSSALLFLCGCKFKEAPSAGLAKEMCSCLFVAEQTEDYCQLVTKESRILAKWEVDYTKQEVTAKGMNFVSKASLDEDSRFGCSIRSVEKDPDS
jgi:uncharacterized protein YjiK